MQEFSPTEAWDDFYTWAKATHKRMPGEVAVAECTRRGNVRTKRGKVSSLGVVRISRLLEKYRPGHYTLVVPEPYFITKKST